MQTSLQPATDFIAVKLQDESLSIAYFDRAGTGVPIVFVHGLGNAKENFLDLIEDSALSERRLIAFDFPGCGDSPYPANVSLDIDDLLGVLESFIDSLKLTRFVLVGASMGGLITLLYVQKHPERVAAFVNIEGNLAPEDCLFSRKVVPHSYEAFIERVLPLIRAELATRAGRGFAEHLKVLQRANARAYYDSSFQLVDYSDRGDLLGRFLSLPVPCWFFYGSENRHLSYLERLRTSHCSVVEIPNANHFLFYDAPREVAEALSILTSGANQRLPPQEK